MSYRYLRLGALVIALAFATLAWAEAAEYRRVNVTASQISFTYDQMGQSVYGRFRDFTATLDFDTENPSAASAQLTIQLNSIDVGNSDTNSLLQQPGWFDTATYPLARFESSSVEALGNNRYEVTGKLALKGQTRQVNIQVSLTPEHAIGVFHGGFVLKRSDFGVGEGEWAGFGVVSEDIQVEFRLVAPEQ